MTAQDPSQQNQESDVVSVAHAPWLDIPDIVAEVQELKNRFSAADLCVADILCDSKPADDTAFILVNGNLDIERLSFGELAQRSKCLASALSEQGIGVGSRVGVLMAKTRQLPIVLLALWRLGAVHVPLFTAFGNEAIASRVNAAQARLIIADPDQCPKLVGIDIPVLKTGANLDTLIESHPPLEHNERIGQSGTFIELYTSGTTGAPKGVRVPAYAIASFIAYMRYGFDLQANDVLWNGADPGWAYGLFYSVVGPMATGRANVLLAAPFTTAITKQVVDALRVTNFASAPTVYRALRKDGIRFNTPLRVASSAGEPLTPEITDWAPKALGCLVRDHWGQTEQGMGVINAWDPRLLREPKAGSMGQAMPGFVVGTVGDTIALSVPNSPLMWFTGYANDARQTQERYTKDKLWYLSGDAGRHDGTDVFFAARADDVIIASGYRISPFDIESILALDPAVSEAAVVGRRYADSVSGEVIEAFITLASDAATDGLVERLQDLVRVRYGRHGYPRHIHIVDSLPKTPSGKIRRVDLRNIS
ncbi:AMP-binding protein [Castellaniella sp.]|uniref:AMP-binding protein n=1 Tax=Castellaniella sp. TaxID=1955812 RepID=UPI0035673B32